MFCVYSRNAYMTTHAVILSSAKDLLADNQTMAVTKNGDLDSTHLRGGKPKAYNKPLLFKRRGLGRIVNIMVKRGI